MEKLLLFFMSLFSLTTFANTDPQKAFNLSREGKAVIVDVREADELRPGMIQGAQWFPLSKIQKDKNWKDDFLKQTKGKKIFLYCRSGNRSGKVENILKEVGVESENIGGYESLKTILPIQIPVKQ